MKLIEKIKDIIFKKKIRIMMSQQTILTRRLNKNYSTMNLYIV